MGGLVGANIGTLVQVTASGNVSAGSGSTGVGGIAGYNAGLISVSNSSSNVTVDAATSYAAAGVGWNDLGGTIAAVSVAGNVTAGTASMDIGGLVGLNGNTVNLGNSRHRDNYWRIFLRFDSCRQRKATT